MIFFNSNLKYQFLNIINSIQKIQLMEIYLGLQMYWEHISNTNN